MPSLSCPHCGARGDSRDESVFDVRGQAHGRVVYKCMVCTNGLTKGVLGRAKPIPAEDWVQIERRFESLFGTDSVASEDIAYTIAASVMARAASRDDDLYEQDQFLAAACLTASGRTLDAIAAANRGPIGERLRSGADDDSFTARAVTSMAYYYLFAFGEPHIPAADRGEWAEGMLRALAPVEEAIPADIGPLGPLFDSYARREESDGGSARFALRYTRWFLANTTGEQDEDLTDMAMGEIAAGAASGMEAFGRDLSAVGLR